MTWIYNNKEFLEEDIPTEKVPVGFVYRITNLTDGREYIGKKNLAKPKTSVKTVTLKNGNKKKKKIKSFVSSDWMTYYGSNKELQEDVARLGSENFKREILCFCFTKGELSYKEAELQFKEEVLLHPEKYYNSWIMVRTRRDHIKGLVK